MKNKILITSLGIIFLSLISFIYLNSQKESLVIVAPIPTPIPEPDPTKDIGEHFIIGFRGTSVTPDSQIIKDLNTYQIGGVILFDYDVPTKKAGRNIASKSQTIKLINDLKKYTGHPIFVAIDAEGGSINRFKSFGHDTPLIRSAQDLGKNKDYILAATADYQKLAAFLKELGFNLNFGPVIDVNVNPQNPIIGLYKRSYSDDPEKVTALAKIFIETHREKGILTSLKHYPGHGSSQSDSHKGFVDITKTYQPSVEIKPWQSLIKANLADSVMIGHLFDKTVDPTYPASLSTIFIKDKLKKDLGFTGLVISDDLHMKAITNDYGLPEAITLALAAGTDLIILSNNIDTYDNNLAQRVTEIVKEAIKNGSLDQQSLRTSAAKIRSLKNF